MTKKFCIAALAASLGLVTLAMGQGPRRAGGPGRDGGGQVEALKTYLGLSDTQVAALRQARTDAFEQAKPEMKENSQKARDLRAEMNKANPDPNAVGRLMTEMKATREQARANQTRIREQSLAVLTEAQKAKLKTLEEAAALQGAIREARMSGLLTTPEAGADSGPGMMMRGRGFGHRE